MLPGATSSCGWWRWRSGLQIGLRLGWSAGDPTWVIIGGAQGAGEVFFFFFSQSFRGALGVLEKKSSYLGKA